MKYSSPARQRRNRWRRTCFDLRLALLSAISRTFEIGTQSAKEEPDVNASLCNDGKGVRSSTCNVQDYADSLRAILEKDIPCAIYFKAWTSDMGTPSRGQRQRSIFPLPWMETWLETVPLEGLPYDSCLQVANSCLCALNFLNYNMKLSRCPNLQSLKPTVAQLSVLEHIAKRVVRFLSRLIHDNLPFRWESAFDQYELTDSCDERISSSSVDLPSTAATCDPLKLVSESLKNCISKASNIFPSGLEVSKYKGSAVIRPDDKYEYIRLAAKELLCGKLRLRLQVQAIGGVFVVPKKDGGRQRKIWNGSQISEAAACPPVPRRLANPSSFLDIFAEESGQLLFSKRDAATYFDTLRVPSDLQPWLGQPGVTVEDFQNIGGLSLEQLEGMLDQEQPALSPKVILYPVHTVWPMGFSWSSAIAQDCTLACCLKAGIRENAILSPDYEGPDNLNELCFIATDDVILAHTDRERGSQILHDLDQAFLDNGIPKNEKKDVNMESSIIGLGCHLCSNAGLVEPEAHRVFNLTCALVSLLHHPICSPKAFNRMLGVLQWLYLLQRPMFSILDESYKFTLEVPATAKRELPNRVLNEMLVALLLLPLLPGGLNRRFLGEVFACDAAPDFGFGVASAMCGETVARELCRLGERRGDYIKLFDTEPQRAAPNRIGRPHLLQLQKSDFRILVSSRAKWQAHSGILESHGLLLTLRCISQDKSKHHSRVPILIDAKAILGAAAKGRSSAKALHGSLRAIAANSLAADVLYRLIYIPSEHNPADAPSRGKRWRHAARVRQPSKRWRGQTRLERDLLRLDASWRHLKAAGVVGDSLGSDSLDTLSDSS